MQGDRGKPTACFTWPEKIMKTLKLTNTQYDLIRSLVLNGDQLLSEKDDEDYDNNTKYCEDMYGKNFRIVRKNLFKKLRIKN